MRVFLLNILFLFLTSNLLALNPRYHTLDEVRTEILALQNQFPQIVFVDTLAYTGVDSLPIWVVKISSNPTQNLDKPATLVVGAHHAEEILGVESTLWTMNELTQNYSQGDSLATLWINSLEMFFIPVLNPEGFRFVTESAFYSQVTGIDSLTLDKVRKNKFDSNGNGVYDAVLNGQSLEADGVDLNRNYDINWNLADIEPMSSFFKGNSPFSEPEVQLVKDLAEQEKFVFAILYHSSRLGSNAEKIFYCGTVNTVLYPDVINFIPIADSVRQKLPKDSGVGVYSLFAISDLNDSAGKGRFWFYIEQGTFAFNIELGSVIHPESTGLIDSICVKSTNALYELFERSQYGIVKVKVTDGITGQPIVANIKVTNLPNASLNLIDLKTEPIHGSFFKVLSPDSTFDFEISLNGYLSQTFTGIVPSADSILTLNLTLLPDSVIDDWNSKTKDFRLLGNYPNPFNPKTNINYFIPESASVKFKIIDVRGRLVKELSKTQKSAGYHTIIWDGKNKFGEFVSSGIYFYKFTFDSKSKGRISKKGKMVLLK
ncbi:MAG: T9SS C-terminal target domain-containing protein [Calditrichaeota bacterium]|nr:MAG: T9SS C-terminal target domain-containing protein [Calditrichota bacterium]